MNRTRTLLAACALVLPIAAIGCGGEDSEDPREVIERAFSNEDRVASGVIDVGLEVAASGEQGGSFSATLSGPFDSDPDDPSTPPQVDLEASASGSGGGETVDESARVVLTEDNAFIEYGDETYEAGSELFAEFREGFSMAGEDVEGDESFRQACEELVTEFGGDTAACEIDVVNDWITDLENEGTEDVEGAETTHVSGALDVEQAAADITEVLATIPGFELGGFDPSQIAAAVDEAGFDVYAGTEDDHIRRFEIALAIDPAALTGGLVAVPIEDLTLDFSTTFSEVNEPQTIEAPSGPTQPLEDLFGEVGVPGLGGGAGGLGGLPDLGTEPGGGDPGTGPDDGPGAPGDEQPGGGGAEVDPEQAQQYLECIQDAGGDPDAINACAEELE